MHGLRALRRAIACAGFLAASLGSPAAAQAVDATGRGDSVRPAPIVTRGDLGRLAFGAGLAALATSIDRPVRERLREPELQRSSTLNALEHGGDLWGGGGTLAAGLVLWGGGRVAGRPTVAAAGLRAVEAVGVSGVITGTLKGLFGRARPRTDSLSAWDFQLLRGMREGGEYQSMPSGHTTAAFAFAAAVTGEVAHRAPRHARAVGVTTFALAGLTGWSRMHSNAHWLSDVTMGATIGMVSGWAVTRFHRTRPANRVDALLLGADLAPLVTSAPGGRTVIGATLAWR